MLSIVVDKKDVNVDYVSITNEKDIRHMVNVYRLKVGDNIRVQMELISTYVVFWKYQKKKF